MNRNLLDDGLPFLLEELANFGWAIVGTVLILVLVWIALAAIQTPRYGLEWLSDLAMAARDRQYRHR